MNASPVAVRRVAQLARLRQQIDALAGGRPPLAPAYAVALTRQVDRLAAQLADHPDDPVMIRALDRLIDEVLVTYGGNLARAGGLDGGVCALADRLIAEINPLEQTVPCISGADDEYGALLATIRVRFPTSVWSLPFVAHELGHQVAFRHVEEDGVGLARRSTTPIAAVFEPFRGRTAWSHAGELFSDVMATWTLGPAFPAALISLCFDDGREDTAGEQHPSPSVRIAACRRTLSLLDELDDSFAAPLWAVAARLEARRRPPEAPPAAPVIASRLRRPGGAGLTDAEVEQCVNAFLGILRTGFGHIRYHATEATQRAERYLRGDADLPRDLAVRAMLDAAWRVRSGLESDPGPELSARVTTLFRTAVPDLAGQ